MGHAERKLDKLDRARRLYLTDPNGVSDKEVAEILGVDRHTIHRYRKELGAVPVPGKRGRYTLTPSEDDVKMAELILKRAGK